VQGATRKAREAGLAPRRGSGKVPASKAHSILRNRFYTGCFEWNGKMIQGRHEPLVSIELWERVQGVLDHRFAKKHPRMTHHFAFSGLLAYCKCGCSVVGEIKKQRYVYYQCRGAPATCRRKYVREEVLEAQFTELLGWLGFDDEVLARVREALQAKPRRSAPRTSRGD
jgi:site-specific DNA recombinase